jgi:hypothetical protein
MLPSKNKTCGVSAWPKALDGKLEGLRWATLLQGTVRVWNAESSEALVGFEAEALGPYAVFSPSGR